jgi:uncharacterized protein YfaA (DUF2138 family)
MKPTTIELIKNVLAADETIPPDEANVIEKQLKASASGKKTRPGTIKEAAKILDVHPVTVRRYAQAGLLTPIRITSRKVRYDLNEVQKLAESGSLAP